MSLEKKDVTFKTLELLFLIITYLMATPFAVILLSPVWSSIQGYRTGDAHSLFFTGFSLIFGIIAYFFYSWAYRLQIKLIRTKLKDKLKLTYVDLVHRSVISPEDFTFKKFVRRYLVILVVMLLVLLYIQRNLFINLIDNPQDPFLWNYIAGLFIIIFVFIKEKKIQSSD